MNKIRPSIGLLKEINSIKNLEDYSIILEKEHMKCFGPETSDISFSELRILADTKNNYIYIATLKYGHLDTPEILVKHGNKDTFLNKENYENTNGFKNEWHQEGSKAIMDFEKLKYMQYLDNSLIASNPAKKNKI